MITAPECIPDLRQAVARELLRQGHRDLTLHVHPIMEAYITKGNFFKKSLLKKWSALHKIKLKLAVDNNAPITQYHFYDSKTDDLIKL